MRGSRRVRTIFGKINASAIHGHSASFLRHCGPSLPRHINAKCISVWSRHASVLQLRACHSKQERRSDDDDEYYHTKAELARPIIKIMADIRTGGDFCAGGRADLPPPGLCIQGVGQIAFPLLPQQAVDIKSIASQAPYGRGPDTVIDLTVRNTLQVDPWKVTFANPEWEQAFKHVVKIACDKMGLCAEEVKTELYKILLYEEGSHFKPHVDTEKADGMFGTLVLQFPCQYDGGSVVVKHGDIQREFKMGSDDGSCKFSYQYVAHFADCRHEVKAVTSGNRLVAVYSMCMKNKAVVMSQSAPAMEHAVRLAKELPKIGDKCFGLLMTHLYTSKSISKFGLGALKGIDQALAGNLIAASNIMKDQNADNELVLKISLLSRIRYSDCPDAKVTIDHVFAEDGSDAEEGLGNPNELRLIRQMKFFDDILNYREDKNHRIRTYNDFGDPKIAAEFAKCYARTGKNAQTEWYWTIGAEACWMFWEWEEYYTGNEGEADKYSGYVLSFHRKGAKAEEECKKRTLDSDD